MLTECWWIGDPSPEYWQTNDQLSTSDLLGLTVGHISNSTVTWLICKLILDWMSTNTHSTLARHLTETCTRLGQYINWYVDRYTDWYVCQQPLWGTRSSCFGHWTLHTWKLLFGSHSSKSFISSEFHMPKCSITNYQLWKQFLLN